MNKARRLSRLVKSLATAFLVATAALVVAGVVTAPSADGVPSTPAPIREPGVNNVTADALPTAQIDGVVWSQAIIGNTVFAGGQFSYARGRPVQHLVPTGSSAQISSRTTSSPAS